LQQIKAHLKKVATLVKTFCENAGAERYLA